jgi:hypothetical protein
MRILILPNIIIIINILLIRVIIIIILLLIRIIIIILIIIISITIQTFESRQGAHRGHGVDQMESAQYHNHDSGAYHSQHRTQAAHVLSMQQHSTHGTLLVALSSATSALSTGTRPEVMHFGFLEVLEQAGVQLHGKTLLGKTLQHRFKHLNRARVHTEAMGLTRWNPEASGESETAPNVSTTPRLRVIGSHVGGEIKKWILAFTSARISGTQHTAHSA